ncbi:YEATS domain-containing protein 2-like [Coregonus clupeaformis]|uniref:YEATS domain-containing protein 2-like n=1 Tax=Coregonus clupeaformis TaxID=59861 RepID=UPI001BE04B07|nr:YEATS domain-containing protein 2-like [Coregonus clupeaformis]
MSSLFVICFGPKGSPISTPSRSPLPRTLTSTPVHTKQGSSVLKSPYIIVDKPGQVIRMAMTSFAASTGHYQAGAGRSSHSAAADGFHGNGSPAARRGNSAGSHLISMSPQRQTGGAKGAGATTSMVLDIPLGSALQVLDIPLGSALQILGIPVGSALQVLGIPLGSALQVLGIPLGSALQILGIPLGSALQVAISSGQILVTKGNPSISKVMGGKHVVAQGCCQGHRQRGGR